MVWNIFLFFHRLGIIIPTDELIFFRGVGIPPTRGVPFPVISWFITPIDYIWKKSLNHSHISAPTSASMGRPLLFDTGLPHALHTARSWLIRALYSTCIGRRIWINLPFMASQHPSCRHWGRDGRVGDGKTRAELSERWLRQFPDRGDALGHLEP